MYAYLPKNIKFQSNQKPSTEHIENKVYLQVQAMWHNSVRVTLSSTKRRCG